jgi:hypothetical protein
MAFFERETMEVRADYVQPFHTEGGGILSLTTLSGVQHAVYESNPTVNTVPLGMQQHSQEAVDLYRAMAPWKTSRRYPPYTPYPYLILGNVVTNAIHPDVNASDVFPGVPAYLAASGLITTDSTFRRIGTFDSALNDTTIGVPASSLGASRLRVGGNEAIVNPDPVFVATAGWARVRIHI